MPLVLFSFYIKCLMLLHNSTMNKTIHRIPCFSIFVHIYIYIYIYISQPIAIMIRVFTNGPGDQGSISGQVKPKTQKMGLDAFLFNTQPYKV